MTQVKMRNVYTQRRDIPISFVEFDNGSKFGQAMVTFYRNDNLTMPSSHYYMISNERVRSLMRRLTKLGFTERVAIEDSIRARMYPPTPEQIRYTPIITQPGGEEQMRARVLQLAEQEARRDQAALEQLDTLIGQAKVALRSKLNAGAAPDYPLIDDLAHEYANKHSVGWVWQSRMYLDLLAPSSKAWSTGREKVNVWNILRDQLWAERNTWVGEQER
jgi:hypothetical protein